MIGEEKIQELIDSLFIDFFIKIISNKSPKEYITIYNKDKQWLINHRGELGITSINYNYIWIFFEKKYENKMSYIDIQNLIKEKLLSIFKIYKTVPCPL